MKLLIKFPTRGRPAKAMDVLRRYRNQLSGAHDVFFLVTSDQDDPTMNTASMRQQMTDFFRSVPRGDGVFAVGKSRTKVQAINADMNRAPDDWNVVLLASDDMIPIVPHYDAIIDKHMQAHFPDFDGCLWFYDGYTKKICTLVVMGRTYFARFNYIYHPDYHSLWCDNEWTAVAQINGRLPFIDQTIIRHDHFANTGAVKIDAVYRRNETFNTKDHTLFNVRKAQGFFLGTGLSQ